MWKIWRTVVGKLWLTIIGLVTLVLFVLSFYLIQLLEQYYYEQRSNDLIRVAEKAALVFDTDPDRLHAIANAAQFVEAYDTRLVVIGEEGKINSPEIDSNLPQIQIGYLIDYLQQNMVKTGDTQRFRDVFPVTYPNETVSGESEPVIEEEMLVVAVPLFLNGVESGHIIIYQSLDELNETTNKATRLIIYTAGVGIILTTIFAFFLTTRVTQPLRQMRRAADRFSVGQFYAKIPIRTHDEIGQLASTFNHMAKQLDDLVHALSREKEQLSSVLKSMADGVLTVDADGEIILTNPPAERMVRAWSLEAGLHREDKKILPDPLYSILETVIQKEEEVSTDITVQGRVWSVVMAPLYDRNQVSGAVAVLRDMTEERRMDMLRKGFVANVSHELRTPISMLQGYSEALLDGVADSAEERKEIAQIIYDESLRMGRLVNELLDLARMEAGHFQLQLEKTPIADLMINVAKKFSGMAREQKVELHTKLDANLGLYLLDPDRIAQVLINLVDNAIRHTDSGGEVTLVAYEQGGHLHIQVKDTGSGIPEEDLPFVFERFYKADKARTRGKAGTGLGLAIVKNLVQAHGGTIDVKSKVGEGTTFLIQIPISR
ncbi:MAG: HAMP domain-containing protein [Bacillaceae bacterium]|nr:HAMP domain-containing protein [Bacillaceae bacterium]